MEKSEEDRGRFDWSTSTTGRGCPLTDYNFSQLRDNSGQAHWLRVVTEASVRALYNDLSVNGWG